MQNNESQIPNDNFNRKSSVQKKSICLGVKIHHKTSHLIISDWHVLLFTILLIRYSNKRFAAWEIYYDFPNITCKTSLNIQWKLHPNFVENFLLSKSIFQDRNQYITERYCNIGYLIKRARTSKWQDKRRTIAAGCHSPLKCCNHTKTPMSGKSHAVFLKTRTKLHWNTNVRF